ncbi:MAG: GNAT family N-acetyltransferase [Bacteroidetes bacterium]|nr:GNAT family N-acetyltransferase [Bacteroidota bacterium]
MKNTAVTFLRTTLPYLEVLRQLVIQTFTDTYAAMNTPENMQAYIDSTFNEERLAAELENPHCQYWFAMLEGEIVGYIKVNFAAAQTEIQEGSSIEIERIYVLPARKRQGIGESLLFLALDIAKQNRLGYVWLGVWEKNEEAIHFYEKNDYRKSGQHTFVLGDEEQIDFVMRREVV